MSFYQRLVPIYTIGVTGAFMQIWGGSWDLSWHALNLVETFFTPPHTVLYLGIALALIVTVYGFFAGIRASREDTDGWLLAGIRIAFAGGILQLAAGPADFWWHDVYGFDPFLFTPSHSILVVGIVLSTLGMAVGSIRLLQAHQAAVDLGNVPYLSGLLKVLCVISLATFWMGLNAFVYLVTDVDGIAYTFQLGPTFTPQTARAAFDTVVVLLAATGTLILFASKRVLPSRGAATAVALLVMFAELTANIGFRALALGGRAPGPAITSFIPLYVLFVIPIFVFDMLLKESSGRRTTLLAAALVAPFTSYLDGWYSLNLWSKAVPTSCTVHWVCGGIELVPILLIPMFGMGILAGFAKARFINTLAPEGTLRLGRQR